MGSYVGAQMQQQAYRNWARGHVIPDRITLALNAKGLYGPEVDEACGVEEPAVDEWEAGTRYPTWEQLEALARLCEVAPAFLTRAIKPFGVSSMWICTRGRGGKCEYVEPSARLLDFTPAAIAAANLPKSPTPPTNPTPRPPTGRRRLRGVA